MLHESTTFPRLTAVTCYGASKDMQANASAVNPRTNQRVFTRCHTPNVPLSVQYPTAVSLCSISGGPRTAQDLIDDLSRRDSASHISVHPAADSPFSISTDPISAQDPATISPWSIFSCSCAA